MDLTRMGFPDEAVVIITGAGSGIGREAARRLASEEAELVLVGDDASVVTAIDQLAADGTDTDGDGVGDVDELTAGTNPNPGGADFCAGPTPEYGCFAQSSGAALIGIGALLGAWRGRSRGQTPTD